MTLGEKILNARKKLNMSQDTLASLLGVNRVSISNYEKNKNAPTYDKIKKLSTILKTDLGSYGETSIISNFIPLIGKASCGKPAEYDLNGYDPVPVADEIYQDGMYAVESEGDSMLPKIAPGDILYCLCENCTQINNGDIVHYSINDESGVKKYKINEAGTIISLIPINTEFDVITIHHDDKIDLRLSKVVGRYSRF